MTQTTTDAPQERGFDALPLSDELRRALADMGFEKPTPVQAAVFEPATSGRDIVVQARTGTGKTVAYGMPLIDKAVKKGVTKPQVLILCPTRELALQVARELGQLGVHRQIRTVAIYGGAPMKRQVDEIEAGAHIIAGTPGRVLDHLNRGTLSGADLRTLVLDEADEMLSMGFERELNAIIDQLAADRTTWLFSATLPPDIERMARTKLREPEFVVLSGDHIGALSIAHEVYMVTEDKYRALRHVLDIENPESAIVFCNTKEQTQRVAQWLQRDGFNADWLMGDLAQSDRERVLKKTREGQLRFLVATDVAARGIDVSHLTHVINYDFPMDAESYVHRTGRTGRAGRTGTAISLVTPKDVGGLYILRLTYKIRPVERQLPSSRDQRTRQETDIVDALATTFAPRGQAEEHLALARRLMTRDDAEAILAGILREHLTANPELPETAESRRRAKAAPVVVDAPPPFVEPAAPRRSAATASESTREAAPTPPEMPEPQRREREPEVERPRGPELYVNLGRRDGVRAHHIKTVLADGGIHPDHVGQISVRDRCSFVEVDPSVVEPSLEVLNAATIVDKRVEATLSKRSQQG